MRVVCPDGTVAMRKALSTELESKLQQLSSFTWFNGRPESSQDYLERVRDADGVLLIWDIPSEVLSSCPRLRTIAFTGTDPRKFIDLPLATSTGIAVTNTPHYGDQTVAVLGLEMLGKYRISVASCIKEFGSRAGTTWSFGERPSG